MSEFSLAEPVSAGLFTTDFLYALREAAFAPPNNELLVVAYSFSEDKLISDGGKLLKRAPSAVRDLTAQLHPTITTPVPDTLEEAVLQVDRRPAFRGLTQRTPGWHADGVVAGVAGFDVLPTDILHGPLDFEQATTIREKKALFELAVATGAENEDLPTTDSLSDEQLWLLGLKVEPWRKLEMLALGMNWPIHRTAVNETGEDLERTFFRLTWLAADKL
jgi:hypothetical protein